ncbi:hypothetical protein B566_EDAN003572, partial [Ephemera danica]
MYGVSRLTNLKTINLAHNGIVTIEGLRELTQLRWLSLAGNSIKELRLHGNKIQTLQFCERYLPISLRSLSLAGNQLTDLNDIAHLSHLANIEELRIANNPCFRPGEQAALAEYLATVCPLSGESLRTEEEQKLLLILSKAQQHQRQLWEETTRTGVEKSSSASAVVNSNPPLPNSAESPSTPGTRQRQGSVKKHPS